MPPCRSLRAEASWPLELPEDVVGEGLIEVGRDRELASAQAERARPGGGRRQGPDFRQRAVIPHQEERFSRLDTPEEGQEVVLDFLHGDGAHAAIVACTTGPTS